MSSIEAAVVSALIDLGTINDPFRIDGIYAGNHWRSGNGSEIKFPLAYSPSISEPNNPQDTLYVSSLLMVLDSGNPGNSKIRGNEGQDKKNPFVCQSTVVYATPPTVAPATLPPHANFTCPYESETDLEWFHGGDFCFG